MSAAFYLLRFSQKLGLNIDLTLVEKSDSLGGVFKSTKFNGINLDLGPECFLTSKPAVLDLANDLGIGSQILKQSERKTFIASDSHLSQIPAGLFSLTPQLKELATSDLFSFSGKLRMAMEPFVFKREVLTDESVAQFIERRFGKELLEKLAEPMINGLYGMNPENISAQLTMPLLTSLERKHGSVINGLCTAAIKRQEIVGLPSLSRTDCKGSMATFAKGMTALVDEISKYILGKCQLINAKVDAVTTSNAGMSWQIQLADKATIDADAVLIALPAASAGKTLLQTDRCLSGYLQSVPYSSPIIVSLVYDNKVIETKSLGSGFLIQRKTRQIIRACTFSSNKFKRPDYQEKLVLRISTDTSQANGKADDEVKQAVIEDLKRFVRIEAEPLFSVVERHDEAIPQFAPGHGHLLKEIELRANRFRNLGLAGNAFGAIGVADCIKKARDESHKLLNELALAT